MSAGRVNLSSIYPDQEDLAFLFNILIIKFKYVFAGLASIDGKWQTSMGEDAKYRHVF